MRVLVACEFSGVVRDAFTRRGHYAVSCDLLPSECAPLSPGRHEQGDVRQFLDGSYIIDLMIAFPPCTHLAVSGARWFKDKQTEQQDAIAFFLHLATADVPRIAIENPIGIMSNRWRKPDQIIQPWQFGHPETKATCLWLKNLPPLVPTNDVSAEMRALPARKRHRVHHASPGPDRWKNRSRTYQGIADAMAEQWGNL